MWYCYIYIWNISKHPVNQRYLKNAPLPCNRIILWMFKRAVFLGGLWFFFLYYRHGSFWCYKGEAGSGDSQQSVREESFDRSNSARRQCGSRSHSQPSVGEGSRWVPSVKYLFRNACHCLSLWLFLCKTLSHTLKLSGSYAQWLWLTSRMNPFFLHQLDITVDVGKTGPNEQRLDSPSASELILKKCTCFFLVLHKRLVFFLNIYLRTLTNIFKFTKIPR